MSEPTLLTERDLDEFVGHFGRQVAESGREGLPVFNPFASDHRWDLESLRARRESAWALPLDSTGWKRTGGEREGARIVGHLELEGGSIEADLHRASLVLGVEHAHHRRGVGTRLMRACIEWSVAQLSLSWIDLSVFAHNAVALGLFRRMGFVEAGATPDRFRVAGRTIDDLHLVLSLERMRGQR